MGSLQDQKSVTSPGSDCYTKDCQHSSEETRNSHLMAERKKKYTRFERKNSNSLCQMDIMGEILIEGVKVYPISVLDDCSRKILACHLYTRERAKEVVKHSTQPLSSMDHQSRYTLIMEGNFSPRSLPKSV